MNLINRVLDEKIYKIIVVFLSLMFCIPYIMEIIDLLIDITVVWGCLIICKIIFESRLKIKKCDIILFIFLVSYAITVIINGFNINDVKVLLYLSISFIIFFHTAKPDEKIGNYKVLDIVLTEILLFSFIISVLSLGMLFTKQLFIIYTELTTNVSFVGIHANHSLYGVIGNSNRLSWLCIISIGVSLYYLYQNRLKRSREIALWINIFLQIIAIYFTNSRGGIVGLMAYTMVFCFLILKYKLNLNTVKSSFLSILAVAAIVLADPVIKNAVKSTIGNFTPKTVYEQHLATKDEIFSSKFLQNGFINKSVRLNEKDFEKDIGQNNNRSDAEMQRTTSARLDAYQAGFKLFSKYPVFGLGKENSAQFVKEELPKESLLRQYDLTTNLHSIYITALVASGVVGFSILLVFILRMVYQLFVMRRKIETKDFALIAILLSLLAINLFESEILYTRVFSAFIFWYFLGILSNKYNDDKQIDLIKLFKNDKL